MIPLRAKKEAGRNHFRCNGLFLAADFNHVHIRTPKGLLLFAFAVSDDLQDEERDNSDKEVGLDAGRAK